MKDQRIQHKINLQNTSRAILEQRILQAKMHVDEAQRAANEEEKSSAGDKFETGRAMSHLNIEMHSRQLEANNKELSALLSIDCSIINNKISEGSVIKCNSVTFFIIAGLGKITFESETVYVISPVAPLARDLFSKGKGDSFIFNKIQLTIIDAY